MAERGDKVLVGLSGGVDSSVAAALLQEQGHDVHGLILLTDPLHPDQTPSAGLLAARRTAQQLSIPLTELDCRSSFRQQVLQPCWLEYARGRTPNPCALCNPRLKFALLAGQAERIGARWIATGHHVRVQPTTGTQPPVLLRGLDPGKDQSYFLFGLDAATLGRCLFPIGEHDKADIRRLAEERQLANAAAADSQDTCVALQHETFPDLLRGLFSAPTRPGPFVDMSGQAIGRHAGFHRFTIGQRRGLNLALGRPAWVCRIQPEAATVQVTTDPADLLARGLEASGVHWGPAFEHFSSGACRAQIRYRHPASPAQVVRLESDRIRVRFDRPQRAITPGQAVVIYHGHRLVAGGWIDRSIPEST